MPPCGANVSYVFLNKGCALLNLSFNILLKKLIVGQIIGDDWFDCSFKNLVVDKLVVSVKLLL